MADSTLCPGKGGARHRTQLFATAFYLLQSHTHPPPPMAFSNGCRQSGTDRGRMVSSILSSHRGGLRSESTCGAPGCASCTADHSAHLQPWAEACGTAVSGPHSTTACGGHIGPPCVVATQEGRTHRRPASHWMLGHTPAAKQQQPPGPLVRGSQATGPNQQAGSANVTRYS